uniref:Uncharacterized protein n=1 Tax=Mycobacterium riyadhense TaxID=486698 RepID=A0A653EXY5_9MYCO|nr:hypothetical protein BIN_B_04193 [Mycobacterium riyadhense]
MNHSRDILTAALAARVPEIACGSVEIVSVAREPGKWAKVAVDTHVSGINPAGVCIGVAGVRVADVEKRLGGEHINIVRFHPEPTRYVLNALKVSGTAEVTDPHRRHIRVIVASHDYARALGKTGHNVRLARRLTGWTIQICTTECAGTAHHHPASHTPPRVNRTYGASTSPHDLGALSCRRPSPHPGQSWLRPARAS